MRHVQRSRTEVASLYSPRGERKYLNAEERRRVLAALHSLPRDRSLFIALLAWAGARPTELLELTHASFQIAEGVVAIRTLKRRSFSVREVPIPPELMRDLDDFFTIAAHQRAGVTNERLFPWSRTTVWRSVKQIMKEANVTGVRACPKGLRHAFGTSAISCVPLNIVSRWMGHSQLSTTAIYAAAIGPEEVALARRFWRAAEGAGADTEVHAASPL
jgi:integrase